MSQGAIVRTINMNLVEEYAEQMRPLLPQARRAYGTQGPASSARQASDKVNVLLLEYVNKGGNVTHLANELEGVISLAGLRRRLRSARNGRGLLGSVSSSRKRGSKDPARVDAAAKLIEEARHTSPAEYGKAVRSVYAENISLSAVADEMGVSYFSLWTAGSLN
jgi:hypothetical protein